MYRTLALKFQNPLPPLADGVLEGSFIALVVTASLHPPMKDLCSRASKFMKQKWRQLKIERNKIKMKFGDFNILLSAIGTTNRQKSSQDIEPIATRASTIRWTCREHSTQNQ